MSKTRNLEQEVLHNLRILSFEKQQEVLDFVEFLVQKTENNQELYRKNSELHTKSSPPQQKRLSLQKIAKLPVAERHKILEPFIDATAEDFVNDPELTEFSVLDGKDWETKND
jgi:hypothetical protein